MIKFFRKIRQKLLSENKFSKYLIYAVGEIVLVVIGILIALQINNNNIFEQTRELEKEYLHALKSEFATNLEKMKASSQESAILSKNLLKALSLYNPITLDTITTIEFNRCLYIVGGTTIMYNPANGVISDVINSGKLSIISNKSLRVKLGNYNSDLQEIEKHVNYLEKTQQNIQEQIKKHGSMRSLLRVSPLSSILVDNQSGIDNKDLFKSIEFENNLYDYYLGNLGILEKLFPTMEKTLLELIKDINTELGKRNDKK